MWTKTKKKNRKNLKIENFEKTKKKNGLEIWWRGIYAQNLAWIHAVVSEKLEFTDGGRTDRRTMDACAMTVALLTKSSRAKNKTACHLWPTVGAWVPTENWSGGGQAQSSIAWFAGQQETINCSSLSSKFFSACAGRVSVLFMDLIAVSLCGTLLFPPLDIHVHLCWPAWIFVGSTFTWVLSLPADYTWAKFTMNFNSWQWLP